MTPRDIETLSLDELFQMYRDGQNQYESGRDMVATADYASRLADVEARRERGGRLVADGQIAASEALAELQRRVGRAA